MIKFDAAFGNQTRYIELMQPNGAGGDYVILIDRLYNGSINKTSDGWRVYFNSDQFTATDADILIDMIAHVE
ncbi:hypothetical protein ACFSR6_03385 [Pedobacter vanadiisoli]|uniref:Uncharacterized protein n=1 Tax=Pedobacter vanadiisoli TaxID=1761975 RepID=A0ABW5ME79_9SPHI